MNFAQKVTRRRKSGEATLNVYNIIEQIIKNSNVDEKEAIRNFYQSKLYQELSDEKSKLWHYGPLTLYTMYQDELLMGTYDYPEEA